MVPIRCPETLVQNYHSTLRNIPKERAFHLHRVGSLNLRTVFSCFFSSSSEIKMTRGFITFEHRGTIILGAECFVLKLINAQITMNSSACYKTQKKVHHHVHNSSPLDTNQRHRHSIYCTSDPSPSTSIVVIFRLKNVYAFLIFFVLVTCSLHNILILSP